MTDGVVLASDLGTGPPRHAAQGRQASRGHVLPCRPGRGRRWARRRRAGPADDERGSVAAEFSIALPAVLLTLLLGVGSLQAAATQVALQDAAADAARLLGRGEPAARAAGMVHAAVDGARMATRRADDLVCVSASAQLRVGRLISIPLTAQSCALDGGL